MQNFSRISGLLIDLEGVLYSDNKLIKGVKDLGIKTIQVKTGKYQENDSDNIFVKPDERIESILDVVKLLIN